MSCFICDLVTSETYKIFDTITLYRGIPLYNVLYDFISKYFDVEIDDADIVCNTCNTLLDALNRFRCEFDNVERMLQSQITRKYKLKETQVCRLTKHFHKGTNKRFGCVECSFETDFVDCLMPHNWLHEHQTDFVNTSTASLVDHSFGTNICDNCNVDFSTSELLELHLLEFHADKVDSNPNSDTLSVQLESDGESENNDASFIDETVACDGRNHNPVNDNVLQCKKCLETFNNRRDLQQHLRSIHFFCEICNTKCRSETTLQAHIRRQHTKHVCDKCGKVLGSLGSHRAHQATHGIDLKFTCQYCNKGFRAKSLLDHHIVIHTKESNFTCHICGQKFIHQRTLRLHIQWHSNPRPHKCSLCDKTYKHISHLAVHRRSHTGELPKACQFCDKRFASASKLNVHMVKHTGIYSHPCQLCNRGYMKRYKLAEHMVSAHGDNTMLVNKPKCEYKMIIRPELSPHRSDEVDLQ